MGATSGQYGGMKYMFHLIELINSIEVLDLCIDQLSRKTPIMQLSYPHIINLSIMSFINSIKPLLFHVSFFKALNEAPLLRIADIIDMDFAKVVFLIGCFSPLIDQEYIIFVSLLNSDSSILMIQSKWFKHFTNL